MVKQTGLTHERQKVTIINNKKCKISFLPNAKESILRR